MIAIRDKTVGHVFAQKIQGSAKRWASSCVDAESKVRQKQYFKLEQQDGIHLMDLRRSCKDGQENYVHPPFQNSDLF